MNLGELFRELMKDAQPRAGSSVGPDGSTEWDRDGVVFAVIDAGGVAASFRLDPEFAEAARRTPDVAASPRGEAWVTFRPAALDEHAEDRALAWFEAAHRRATA